eukprot:TRINITY_DN1443_c0_g1_i7.p1 TRINITY_DN1443_c0_g1~~TRINITY_DN1443_c0_g1_i7.p1  ORF type:complete len:338 (+),score=119.86 TRINITY_DN1443_c0_g1_i7:1075-2088(+)
MAENIQLRRDATSLKAECEKLKKVVSDGALESGRQESAVKKLGAQLSQRQEEMNRMAQNAKVMSEEIKDQASYIEKMQENYNRLCMENSQLKKIQDDYMKESAEAWEQNKQLKSQLNETRGMLEGVNSELQMTKEHLDSVLPENENLRHVVDELKAKLDQAIDDNKKLVEEQDVIISQDSLKLQSSMDACKGLTEEVGRLRTDNEKLKAENVAILDWVKKQNEEKRKRKEDKVKRFTQDVRQQKANKSMMYPGKSAAKELPVPQKTHVSRIRTDISPLRTAPSYYPAPPKAMTPKRNPVSIVDEAKAFMEDDDEVSVTFQEFLDEVMRAEGKTKDAK